MDSLFFIETSFMVHTYDKEPKYKYSVALYDDCYYEKSRTPY